MEGLPPWLLLVKGRRMGVIVELGALGFSRSNKSPLTLGGGGGREGISCVLPPPSLPRPAGTRVVDQSRPLWEIPLGPAVSPSIAKSSGDVVLASDGRLSLWLVWRGLWCLSSRKNVSLLLGLKSVNFSF